MQRLFYIASFVCCWSQLTLAATYDSNRWEKVDSLRAAYPWFRTDLPHPLIYHAKEKKESVRIEQAYGPLYIKEMPSARVIEIVRPWAGYWYPISEKIWYQGISSPLHKLQRSLSIKGHTNQIVSAEEEVFDPVMAEAWEGFCDAWAIASTRFVEPSSAKIVNGIRFSVADQKAILTRLHENYDKKMWGILYRGTFETDGTYQDIRPESFHQILLTHMNRGEHVLMDEDPGTEVWTKPIFRFEFRATPDNEFDNAFVVDAYIHFVSERPEESEVPTGLLDTIRQHYSYRLFVEPTLVGAEGYRVLAGEWLGESIRFHPDVVFVQASENGYQTSNSELNRLAQPILDLFSR